MKLAISNIAWPVEQDAIVADVLASAGVRGIEIAPTKIWPKPLDASDAEIDAYRRTWADRGIRIVAAQALLFGQPELTLFESAEKRRETRDYLAGIIRLCARAGAESLVFGSPKNRKRNTMPPVEAFAIAVEFFRELGDLAHTAGTHIVMEANPPEYGADFVTQAREAIELVKAVNHPGFRLHLDTACMTLASDDVHATFASASGLVRHFHVSEPFLEAVCSSDKVNHATFAAALKEQSYSHWVSVEMKQAEPFDVASLVKSLRFVNEVYG